MDQVTGKSRGAETAADYGMNKQPADFSMRLFIKIGCRVSQFIPVLQDLPDGSKEVEEDTKTKNPGDGKWPAAG